MKKQISLIVITLALTLASIGIYTTMNHVTSKSQAVTILANYGTIEFQDDALIYRHSSELGTFPTKVLESLSILGGEYSVYILE